MRPVATKLQRMMAYDKDLTNNKAACPGHMRSYEVLIFFIIIFLNFIFISARSRATIP